MTPSLALVTALQIFWLCFLHFFKRINVDGKPSQAFSSTGIAHSVFWYSLLSNSSHTHSTGER